MTRTLQPVGKRLTAVEIERKGTLVHIEAKGQDKSIFENLTPHPGSIAGDADDLVHIDWSQEWKPDPP